MSKKADLLPTYKRLRQAGIVLNHKLVNLLDGDTITEGGQRLGILRDNVQLFDSESMTSVLMDYCIYNLYKDGMNAVQRYVAQSPPPPGSDEMILLNAMLKARYSVLMVKEVERGVGAVVEDLLFQGTDFLVDINFANIAEERLALATRIIPFEGYITTGGAGLPVARPEMTRILDEINRILGPKINLNRLTRNQESELAASSIRACLESGRGSQIAYQSHDHPRSSSAHTPDPRSLRQANPNDPCPCGSGRKYKSCCGRRPRRK
jgi:hypothetical protein